MLRNSGVGIGGDDSGLSFYDNSPNESDTSLQDSIALQDMLNQRRDLNEQQSIDTQNFFNTENMLNTQQENIDATGNPSDFGSTAANRPAVDRPVWLR